MKPCILLLTFLMGVLLPTNSLAAVLYVSVNNSTPQSPYATWETAATNIQHAVDVALAGDEIVVTNGVYATGGRAVVQPMTNRVAVTKALTVRSVNGPQFTIIEGRQVPGTTNGVGAVRCVYLTNGAVLTGFTLTNGATVSDGGGGVWCQSASVIVSNCVITRNAALTYGGGVYRGTLYNCTLAGNWSFNGGGGAGEANLNHCTLTGNVARGGGGGAYRGVLDHCLVAGNSALFYTDSNGGGVYDATLNHCAVSNNAARQYGGGGYLGVMKNCTITGNAALIGGGVRWVALTNCVLTGNTALQSGGGASEGMLHNCTVTGNSAARGGGVADSVPLLNCIVYYNTALAGPNYDGGTLNQVRMTNCCTTPLPAHGRDNITEEPQLASITHLSANSPCRGAGGAAYARGVDVDSEAWANPPSIGCDELYTGAITGAVAVAIDASYTNIAPGFSVDFRAQIDGRLTASRWEFGDGTVVSNRPYASHSWAEPGDYLVVLRAYNESHPNGVTAMLTMHVVDERLYVAVDGANPVPPYASWTTAATNIQDAVDVATVAGALVLVSNGVYQTGGRVVSGTMTNRVAVTKPLMVRSVNGPAFTMIAGHQVPSTTNGDGAIRCVYLANQASLVGFTLTNGATRISGDATLEQTGGGIWCSWASAVVSNCTIVGNAARRGGGVSGGTLDNCTLIDNWAQEYGGGAYSNHLNHCALMGNVANGGGGVAYSTLNHCTLVGNAASGGGGATDSTLNRCRLTGNSAQSGGGSMRGGLNHCILEANTAQLYGGGSYGGTLNNCTVVGNWGLYGGGTSDGTLNNCIVYFNTATVAGTNYSAGSLNYCCTTPLPPNGLGNINNEPRFVDQGSGNLRLQSNSPCIDVGLNASAAGPVDLDGNPRIVGGTVDLGAYEFQSPQSVIPHAWLKQYGLATDGSVDFADVDNDGYNTWQEWRCLTDPTNSLSALRLVSAFPTNTNVLVTWASVPGVRYFLERSTNLTVQPLSSLATNLIGQSGETTVFTNAGAASLPALFYRVGVAP